MGIEGLVRVERAERHDIEGPGMLRSQANLPTTVTIVNLSRSGCLFRGPIAPPVGTTVSIGVPGLGVRPAEVVRIAQEGVGCAFLALLTEAELKQALAASDAAPSDASTIVRDLRRRLAAEEENAPAPRKTWRQRLSRQR